MRKNIISIMIVALLGYCLIGFYGCAGASKRGDMPREEAMLEPQAMLKFNDIPAPTGFKLLPEGSYSFESGGIRVGILKYQGKANIEHAVNFYKDQMPLYNWSLVNAVEYGERLLNFERETESCIIRLLSKGNNITVTIALGPKSQPKLKKADKPVK